jgi:phospholipid transport system substrate-binding protein
MKQFQNLVPAFFLIFTVWAYSPPAAATEPGPSHVVTVFHESLLAVMKNAKTLGSRGRYEKLAPRIEASFLLPLMARISTGSSWRRATKQQTDKLITAFSRLSISTYASQFDGYSGQSFITISEAPGPQSTVLVKTQILDPGSDSVDITYVTRRIKGRWRILDVLLDGGISQLAVRRSEYRRILKSGGIDGLITTLNAKADQLLVD